MPVNIGDIIKNTLYAMYDDRQLFIMVLIQAIILSIISYALIVTTFGATLLLLANPLNSIITNPTGFLNTIAQILWDMGVIEVVSFLLQIFFVNAIIVKAYYGKRMGIGEAYRVALSRYLYALADYVLVGLGYGLSYLAIILLLLASPLFFIFYIPYFLLAIYAALMISLTIPYATVGKKGPIESLKMSWDSVKGNWWGIFLSLLVISIIYYLITLVASVPLIVQISTSIFTSVLAKTNGATLNASAQSALTANLTKTIVSSEVSAFESPWFFLASVITIIIYSWFPIALTLIYKSLATVQRKTVQTTKK